MRVPEAIRAATRRRGTMCLVFLLWAAWLSAPYLVLGPGSYVRIHDNADSTLALRVSLRSEAPAHLTSSWNSLPLAGLDQGPLINCGPDLDGLLFAVAPGWLAYGLIMFAQRFIAGYFTWRLARDRLGVGAPAAVCAGVVYAMFAQPTINAGWAGPTLYDGLSLAFLPLTLWALDGASGWSLRRRLLLAGLLGALLGLTSHYSGAVFIAAAAVGWVLLRERRSLRPAAAVAAAFALAWLMAEAPVIWSSALIAPTSNRADWALHPLALSDALARQYSYVRGIVLDNAVMVLAALLGLMASRLRDRRLRVALVASAGVLLIVLVSAFWLMGLRRYAGPLSGFQVDRFYLLAPFALIVSGALGLDAITTWIRGRRPFATTRHPGLRPASVTLLVLLLLGPLVSARVQLRIVREMRAGSTYSALYQRPELELLAADASTASPCRVATVYAPQVFETVPDSYWSFLFGPLPAYAWAYGLETVDGYVQMYPESYQQFWGHVAAPALEQDEAMSRYFWDWGNRVYLFIPDTGPSLPTVSDLEGFCDPDLLSLANVRYLISPARLSGAGLVLVAGDGRGAPWPLYVYENTRALPRYFLVGATRSFRDMNAVLTALDGASLEELRTTAFVETRDATGLRLVPSGESTGQIRLDAYEADRVVLTVGPSARSLLVCTMTYSPHWHAYVDGRETDVVRTDATFLGVVVPEGRHRVELRYEAPHSWLRPG